uniref:Uncharacterized protein n=1 Tax=Lactifluus volemus TaxID=71967 RepID=A0A2Z4M8U3_9AGAM|nr:hypothetical protein [Lactifluus volemus]AWX52868.1 hypothetical protein [Lactifluus volemus]
MKKNILNLIITDKLLIITIYIGLGLILFSVIITKEDINMLILLITFIIYRIIYKNKYKKKGSLSWLNKTFMIILIYYLIYIYFKYNVIYLDSTEYLTLYNNIYIKGLNSLVENYGELIAYAVGVKLSSIYLKTLPVDSTFYFNFGLGVGPNLDLTVHQESYDSPVDSNFKNYIFLTVEKVEDHINFLKDMVPYHHKHYKISKMTNMENNTTIISGDAPTNINVVNIHCSLEPGELYFNFFYNFENLVFNISFYFYILYLIILFIYFTMKFINFIKFIKFIN